MRGQQIRLLAFVVVVSVGSTNAKNVTVDKGLAITANGQARSSMVRNERRHAAVERHAARLVAGIDRQFAAVGAALGETGSSFISQPGSDAIGAHVAAVLHAPAAGKDSQSAVQSNGKTEPTMGIAGKIYLRQPAEHKGQYKAREWWCDACHMVAGRGKHGGDHAGCFTVQDFTCAGGEKCLMDDEDTCYFGRVEVPQGIQVTYYSGFSGEPTSDAWANACEGRTNRGTTEDEDFPELKGIVPSDPAVCAMKFELMSGFVCEETSDEEDWKHCGSDEFPPGSAVTTSSSTFLVATAVVLAIFSS